MWAIHYRPPKLKSIPITRSAEKPSSTMANLPARHRPNTSRTIKLLSTIAQIHLRDITRILVPLMPPVIELSRSTSSALKSHLREQYQRRY
jgi:hypothetical protein